MPGSNGIVIPQHWYIILQEAHQWYFVVTEIAFIMVFDFLAFYISICLNNPTNRKIDSFLAFFGTFSRLLMH